MSERILVTYASRSGSTAEVAQAIGKTLSQRGQQVDILAMNDVKDLSPYQAVVLGSAIRGSKWLPEAMAFIESHRSALAQMKCAMFTVCITMAMKGAEKYRSGVMNWTAPARAVVRPVREGLFAGRLDFSKLPFNKDTLMLRLTTFLGIFPRGDHRDWNAIQLWAEELRPVLVR